MRRLRQAIIMLLHARLRSAPARIIITHHMESRSTCGPCTAGRVRSIESVHVCTTLSAHTRPICVSWASAEHNCLHLSRRPHWQSCQIWLWYRSEKARHVPMRCPKSGRNAEYLTVGKAKDCAIPSSGFRRPTILCSTCTIRKVVA